MLASETEHRQTGLRPSGRFATFSCSPWCCTPPTVGPDPPSIRGCRWSARACGSSDASRTRARRAR